MVNFWLDRRMVGRIDPDDVLQEAYLAAAKRIEHFGRDGSCCPFLWLRMIVLQALIDVHRRHLGAHAQKAHGGSGLAANCRISDKPHFPGLATERR
jgi:RNA polymerase sigma-70 factor (ECF subfamily)